MVNRLKESIRWGRIAWLHFRACQTREIVVPSGAIVIVAPHPDDEVLGCGGLIQRLTDQGREVHIVFMTGGEGSHRNCCELPEEQIKDARRKMACQISPMLSTDVSHLHFFNYPDGGISREHSETERLKNLLNELKPTAVFVPHWGEGWPDHLNSAEIVKEIMNDKATIYEYCVWMWYYNVWHLDWKHALIFRMTALEHQQKLRAIDNYTTSKAPCGQPWSGVLPNVLIESAKWKSELYFFASKE